VHDSYLMFPSIVLVDMDFQARCRAATVVVVAMAAWFFMWFRRRAEDARSVTYGPMAERDQQRINNPRYIYESNDVHCVNLLRIKMAPFSNCVTFFVVDNWSLTAYMHLWKNKLQCSCMLLVTIRGLWLLT
jgi:hypothetical protein